MELNGSAHIQLNAEPTTQPYSSRSFTSVKHSWGSFGVILYIQTRFQECWQILYCLWRIIWGTRINSTFANFSGSSLCSHCKPAPRRLVSLVGISRMAV